MKTTIQALNITPVINETFVVDEKDIARMEELIRNGQAVITIPASRQFYFAKAVQLAMRRVYPRA